MHLVHKGDQLYGSLFGGDSADIMNISCVYVDQVVKG